MRSRALVVSVAALALLAAAGLALAQEGETDGASPLGGRLQFQTEHAADEGRPPWADESWVPGQPPPWAGPEGEGKPPWVPGPPPWAGLDDAEGSPPHHAFPEWKPGDGRPPWAGPEEEPGDG